MTSTAGCCRLCMPARTASFRAQPSSGSHSPPSPRMAGGAPALRFGGPRVMALTGALTLTLVGACGVTSKSLRALTARLPGTGYSSSQMTYDLRRLRLNGLIRRIEHTHTYAPAPDGRRIAIFYTKIITACSDRWPPPASPRPHPRYATHWPPSTATSTTTSPKHGSDPRLENMTPVFRIPNPKLYAPSGTSPGRSGPSG